MRRATKVSTPWLMASDRWPPKSTLAPASWAATASTNPTPAANQSTCLNPAGARFAIRASVAGPVLENLESPPQGDDQRRHHEAGQEAGDPHRLQLEESQSDRQDGDPADGGQLRHLRVRE